ncbi:MAG: T9SS type A sorting domain-containing protein [Bacteroidales bacterium]
MSIKVTYDPSTGLWTLYDRIDGTSPATTWADPSTGSYIARGTSSDAFYTGTAMTNFGYMSQYLASGTSNNKYFDNFKVTVTPTSPTLIVSKTSLNGFAYDEGTGPSASQTYNLSGVLLTPASGNVTVSGSTNYEVSTDNTNFSGSVNIGYTASTLASTPIYVRLKAGLAIGNYNSENVINSGGGVVLATNVACSGTINPGTPVTYTWQGANMGDWSVASNWSPTRTISAMNDILQFNDGTTKIVTNVPTQTIRQLFITNNTTVELQSASPATLTINGGTGTDFTVPSGSALNITQATNAIAINLNTGVTGTVGGFITFSGAAAHRITAADASGITFQNGSVYTSGVGLSGNAFGTTNYNSIVFSNGSKYVNSSGANPFGASAPNSVVEWQTGSTYVHQSTASPIMANRTYADFELNLATGASPTFSSPVTMDNLTVTSGTWSLGVKAQFDIKKNLTVAAGASLNLNPTIAGTIVFSGTVPQLINGIGTLATNLNDAVIISNVAGVTLNGSLTTNGALTISSGTFTVASGASLITNGTVTGNVIVERSINAWGDATHGWHFLSSPVAAQAIDPAFTNGTPENYDFYAWWEPSNKWVNFKNTTTAPVWSTANVLGATNGAGSFIPGKGYLVEYAASGTKQFAGALNNSSIAISNLTKSAGTNNGWHLLGNPFASALTWGTADWALTNVNTTAKIWEESSASYVDIVYNTVPFGQTIPAMNGFMVEVSGGTNSLTIPVTARVHNSTPWFKSADNSYIELVARDPGGQTSQTSVVRFDNQATSSFDAAYDSHFLQGYAPQFYSVSGTDHLSVNALPATGGTVQIPFDFIRNNSGNFSIEAKSIANVFGPVILNDLKTSTSQDLKLNPVYSFTSAPGDNPSRFLLTFSHVGINESSAANPFSIFAMNNTIVILNNSGLTVGTIQIYNMLGQKLMQQVLTGSNPTRISMNSGTGYYLVKVVTDTHSYTGKVFLNQ